MRHGSWRSSPSRCARGRRGGLHGATSAPAAVETTPAARAAANHLPRGLHAARHGRPGRRGARDRDRQARGHAAADEDGLPAGERRRRAAGRVPEGLEAELDRGLPLPGDVRVHEAHLVRAPRRGPAAGVPAELAQGRPAVRAVEEPHAVRRPDHRLDDREGGGRARGAEARRGRDLQPAPEPNAARDRRDDPLRT